LRLKSTFEHLALYDIIRIKGSELFWELLFVRLGILLDPFFLPVFLAICSILELEAAISTVFATFWSWNLSFSIEFPK
jgi:hypothetical protein